MLRAIVRDPLRTAHGIDEVMKANNLDALLFPGANGAAIAAKPGYPTVIVPFGFIPNAPQGGFPAGFTAKPAPLGVSFTGIWRAVSRNCSSWDMRLSRRPSVAYRRRGCLKETAP